MLNKFIFGGIDSRDYGVYISGGGTHNAPTRQYDSIAIPGRNGDLLGMNTRLQNIGLTYPAFIYDEPGTNLAGLRSALLSLIGYQRLEDTYHPDEYRLAVYKGGMSADMTTNLKVGEFDVTFECKPQRYLKSGEEVEAFTADGAIFNPCTFASSPLVRVYGSGTIEIGETTVTIASHNQPYCDIDSEVMDCFCGAENLNSKVSFSGNDFPKLEPGDNGVEIAGSIARVEITPRWWRV